MFFKQYRMRSNGTLHTDLEFRMQYPDRCFPPEITDEILADLKVDRIIPVEQPQITYRQRAEVDGVEEVDGVWKWKWVVTDVPDGDISALVENTRTELLASIDSDVDYIYGRVVGNRASEYALAEAEALAYKEAGYSGTSPLTVRVWAKAKGKTNKWAADDIIATAVAWRAAQISIRENRLMSKESVRAATNYAVLLDLKNQWTAFVAKIKTDLGLNAASPESV